MTPNDTTPTVRQFRCNNWRSALVAFADEVTGRPFVWGETDCAMLAMRTLAVLFGFDVLAHIPRWHDARSALRVWNEVGPVAKVLSTLSAPQSDVNFIRAGDIAVLHEPQENIGGEMVLVCIDGVECLVSGPASGVIHVRIDEEPLLKPPRIFSIWEVDRNG